MSLNYSYGLCNLNWHFLYDLELAGDSFIIATSRTPFLQPCSASEGKENDYLRAKRELGYTTRYPPLHRHLPTLLHHHLP